MSCMPLRDGSYYPGSDTFALLHVALPKGSQQRFNARYLIAERGTTLLLLCTRLAGTQTCLTRMDVLRDG